MEKMQEMFTKDLEELKNTNNNKTKQTNKQKQVNDTLEKFNSRLRQKNG